MWSVHPLPPEMLARAAETVQTRMATTPLASNNEKRPIFLSDGGWRWTWLSISASRSFALTRPLTKAVVVNRLDPASGTISNGPIAESRDLGGVLAHEFTHGLIRRRFGVFPPQSFPAWKVEGYCDYVAGESTLTAAEAAQLEAAGQDHPALLYLRGRQRVEAELRRNGGDVYALFGDYPGG